MYDVPFINYLKGNPRKNVLRGCNSNELQVRTKSLGRSLTWMRYDYSKVWVSSRTVALGLILLRGETGFMLDI